MGACMGQLPAVMLIGGPMLPMAHHGEQLAPAPTAALLGQIPRRRNLKHDIDDIEGNLATTAGSCAVMGTASTMAAIAETLGMTLPGTAAIPAVHSDRLRAAEASGRCAAAMIGTALRPSRIVAEQSVENALRVLARHRRPRPTAIIHLPAIAGPRRHRGQSLERLNALSDDHAGPGRI